MQRRAIMSSDHSNPKNRLISLLALLVCIRVLFAVVIWSINGQSGFFHPDSAYYIEVARNMLHGSFSVAGIPEIFRTPGYPALLIPAIAFHHVVSIALIENFLLCAVSAWFIWKIVGELLPESNAAFWAVLLYCFEPMGILFSEKIGTETLFTTVLLLFVWIFLRYLREPGFQNLILAALILGCATYVRPVTMYQPLWLAPVLFFFPRSLPRMQSTVRTGAFLIMFALSLAPWVIRNAVVADYKGFSSTGDSDLYFYCAAAVQAQLEHKNLVQEQNEMGYNSQQRYLALHPEQRSWSPGQSARFFRVAAKNVLLRNPGTYAALHGRGCLIVMFDPGATELMKIVRLYPEFGGLLSRALTEGLIRTTLWLIREYPVSAVLLLLLGAVLAMYYIFAIAGLRQAPFDAGFVLVALFFYFVLISGLPGAVVRYRVPIMPLVCICAGIGIAHWRSKKLVSAEVTAAKQGKVQPPFMVFPR